MRKPLVAGNWKMNGSRESVSILLKQLTDGMDKKPPIDIALFPPALFIPMVAETLDNCGVGWGAQNVYFQESGAFTGEISPAMAKEWQCGYTLVGHSERRTLFGETDADTAKKTAALLSSGIVPVLCVGETLQERKAEETFSVVERQIRMVLDFLSSPGEQNMVIAYEPVWAIGTGLTATPEQAQSVHSHIRGLLREYGTTLSDRTRILYGGSVNAKNADAIFSQTDIDGGLIGGASLKAAEFLTICNATS